MQKSDGRRIMASAGATRQRWSIFVEAALSVGRVRWPTPVSMLGRLGPGPP